MPGGYVGRRAGDAGAMARSHEERQRRLAELEKPLGTQRAQTTRSGLGGGGLPPGGYGGWIPRRVADDSEEIIWTIDRIGAQPTMWIVMDPGDAYGGSTVEVSRDITGYSADYPVGGQAARGVYAADMQANDPGEWFYDNGRGIDLIYSGTRFGDNSLGFGWSNALPWTYDIYLYPTGPGEEFEISLPLPNHQQVTSPWSHYDITIMNDSNETVTVNLYEMLGSAYAGERLMSGTDDGQMTSADPSFTLEPSEWRSWRVSNNGAWSGSVVEVAGQMAWNGYPSPGGGGAYSLTMFGDRWWERHIKGTENCFTFGGGGEAQVVDETEAPRFFNDRPARIGISRVRLSTADGYPPIGGPIIADVLVDGVSIFDAPIELPAGETEAIFYPRDYPMPLGYNPAATPNWYAPLADWPSGSAVKPVILAVGTSEPGRNLTMQIWAG